MNKVELKIRKNSVILESISKQYSGNSKKVKALKNSALAYMFAVTRYEAEFEAMLETVGRPLTPEEEERVKRFYKATENRSDTEL